MYQLWCGTEQDKIFIGVYCNQVDCYKGSIKYLNDNNIEYHYLRTWTDDKNISYIDYGDAEVLLYIRQTLPPKIKNKGSRQRIE